jgi:hypothetical protein
VTHQLEELLLQVEEVSQ